AAVPGDAVVDVAIVGGGFSGLWTAYYLIRHDPTLRIVVLERDFCGFGASGRNGGWAVGELAGSFAKYAKLSSRSESMRLSRAVFDSVDEIGRITTLESVDCDYAKGGTIYVARNSPQAKRQRQHIESVREHGFTEDEFRLLDAADASTYLNATNVQSGVFFGPSAAIDPAKLVRGLANVVEAAGVVIHEQTQVLKIDGRTVHTAHGAVRAAHVVRATEAYTRDLKGERRTLLPTYSLMIATEPLAESLFDEIGLHDRTTFADDRHMVIYGQRTADNRIAFGGRGVPYLYGSRINTSAEVHEPSHELIHETLVDLLPALAGAKVTHRWGGVLGIPRNWVPGLTYDKNTGTGVLGGYVGEGVAASNLAGRTMAELVTGQDTDRVTLPWVGATARKWEPEPLRWLGVRASRRILGGADRREDRSDTESALAYRISRMIRGA
ncbi:MAG: FAD-dependent oxidoreductase, partial [Actinobacteria bacterium]|nr:FAD-dependent oxidoreductase [Actinomycetota bacterium]